jgi:hypothetical protein
VDATMDDIRDQMDIANEISEAISRPVGVGDDLDEVLCFYIWIAYCLFFILRMSYLTNWRNWSKKS